MVAEVVDEPGRENIPEVRSKKLCADCGTSETPLWRGGPAGPKSLCNACGVRRNRKKRRAAVLELTKSEKKASKTIKHNNSTGSCISNSGSGGRRTGHSDSSAKDRLIAVWDSVKPRNVGIEELSEEQQAALLLMTLSHEFKHC